MAFPYIFHSNFEAGSNAEWDSETDTGSLLDFPHYSTLAGIAGIGPALPWRGAYCMRVVCGDTNDHTLIEGDIDIADTVTRYSSFYFYISPDFLATADDILNIYEVQGTANAVENAVGLQITAATDAVEIGVGNVAPTVFFGPIPKGVWHHVELETVVQTGGTGTGTLFLNGAQVAQITTLTNTAVLRGVLGTQNTLSTTTGTLLFDDFKFDDARIYPVVERRPQVVRLTKTIHVFVGPGWINDVSMLSVTGSLDLYDTDTANTNSADNRKVELNLDGGNFISWDEPVYFERGCYAVLAGTNPQGQVNLQVTHQKPGQFGPRYHWSDGALRHYGMARTARPQNV